MAPEGPLRVPITADVDIVTARQKGRDLAERMGCSSIESTMIATAISEIARNIMSHAGRGEIAISAVRIDARNAIEVVATDEGPGIADIERAMQDGYSTGAGLGLGLPGAGRLMDHFEVRSEPGAGTTVIMRKWCP
ncbi:MAG: ATP-binding protein [Candidatus Limnocylindrales bacterium]